MRPSLQMSEIRTRPSIETHGTSCPGQSLKRVEYVLGVDCNLLTVERTRDGKLRCFTLTLTLQTDSITLIEVQFAAQTGFNLVVAI